MGTDAEEGQETARWVTLLGAFGAPLAFLVVWFAPLPLTQTAHRVAAITAAVLIAWVTEVLPLAVTSILIAPALVMTQVMPATKAFASFADPILFLFVGSFFAAKAMARHGLDRRIALTIATLPLVSGKPTRVRAAVITAALLISMWISNTGTTAILLPVLLGMLPKSEGRTKVDSFAAGTLLGLAHASTTGGLATLVGTPPNAITARLLAAANHPIGFLAWMQIGVPLALVLTIVVFVIVTRVFPTASATLTSSNETIRPWSRAEVVTAFAFALAVTGWVVPDLAKVIGIAGADALAKTLDPGAVAVVASSLLFMVPTEKRGPRVLTWQDAVQIEWGLIFLFGGGIALGEAMLGTGLAQVLGEGLLEVTGVSTLWSLTFVSVVIAVVLTEICSNTASANMLVPLVIGAATKLGVSPIPPALAVGLGASCGFMLPVATGPNAIAYGTGLLRTKDMVYVGLWLDAVSIVVVFALLRVICPLLGWT